MDVLTIVIIGCILALTAIGAFYYGYSKCIYDHLQGFGDGYRNLIRDKHREIKEQRDAIHRALQSVHRQMGTGTTGTEDDKR